MAQDRNREQGREAAGSLQRAGAELAPFGRAWYGSPFRGVFEDMERMFESMQRSFFGGIIGPSGGWMPALDVRDAGQEIVVEAELPGIDPKDVVVECRGDMLVVRGQAEERRGDERGILRRSGSFFRQVPLPLGIDVEKARATTRHGILTIRLPKTPEQPEQVKRIPVSMEAREGREKAA